MTCSQTCNKSEPVLIWWTPSIKRSLTKVLEIISLNYSTTDLYIEWSPLLRGCSYFSKVATSSFLLSARLLTFTFSRSIPLYKTRVTNQTEHGKWTFTKSTYNVHLVLSSLKNTIMMLQSIQRTFLVLHRQYSVGSDGNQFKVHII